MKKLILKLNINLTKCIEVKGISQTARLALFDGSAEGEFFKGTILEGGVDTQKEYADSSKPGTLSARYVLEGKDYTGADCRIFVENNAIMGEAKTKPVILTDSKALSFLESAVLEGQIDTSSGELKILIYAEI